MKKTIFIAMLAIAFASVSCGNKKNEPVVNEKKPIVTETFSGIIPAADGPGIEYSATFTHNRGKHSGMYHMHSNYIEADSGSDKAFDSYGNYVTSRHGGERIMVLSPADEPGTAIYFVVDNDNAITMLDREMKRIQSDLNYTLKRMK